MRLLFVVNSIPDIVPTMTTAMLIRGAAERGDETHVCGVDQLELSRDGRLRGIAARATSSASPAALCDQLRAAPLEVVDAEDRDAWLLRTNPARDSAGAHGPALNLARAARERGVVVISVKDRGRGIDIKDQERVFEKFQRGGDPLTRTTRGTGLGLAIVRHIAEAHGGEVRLASELGRGSTFSLVLPVDTTAT